MSNYTAWNNWLTLNISSHRGGKAFQTKIVIIHKTLYYYILFKCSWEMYTTCRCNMSISDLNLAVVNHQGLRLCINKTTVFIWIEVRAFISYKSFFNSTLKWSLSTFYIGILFTPVSIQAQPCFYSDKYSVHAPSNPLQALLHHHIKTMPYNWDAASNLIWWWSYTLWMATWKEFLWFSIYW